MASEILWALAPEYREGVFESYRADLAAGRTGPRAQGGEERDIAAEISRRVKGVAVISINGPIDRQSRIGWFSGDLYAIGQDAIRAALEEAEKDPQVRAILLSINSPGGVVAGTRELAGFIGSLGKPVAAYVNGLAASAAYWLASATGRVFAPATAQVGSIGVIMTLADFSAAYQKMGIKLEHIASGKYKAAGSDSKPLTDEERAYFLDLLAGLHGIFRDDVAARLGISAPGSEWAEAQILIAQKAESLGLVSRLVRDEGEAIQILVEENMPERKITLDLLAAEAPEVLEQIRAQAKSEAAQAADESAHLLVAAMKSTVAPEQVERVEALVTKAKALNLTATQLSGMADMLALQPEKEPAAGNEAVLDALRAAHAAPLNVESRKPEKSALVADAERRAGALK